MQKYTFNANGNMVSDLNKGIRRIAYNRLNLPDTIFFDKKYITRAYDATGVMLRQQVPMELAIDPLPLTLSGESDGKGNLTPGLPIPIPVSRTDYIGSFIYRQGKLKKILTPVGYIEPAQGDNTYYFYQSDYQGNIRAVTDEKGKIIERNDYYPFGMLFGTSVGPDNKQPYKFGGKEYVTAKGYNLYNFGARNLNSSTGGWDTPDPLCENYFPVSPYAYCLNNPVKMLIRMVEI